MESRISTVAKAYETYIWQRNRHHRAATSKIRKEKACTFRLTQDEDPLTGLSFAGPCANESCLATFYYRRPEQGLLNNTTTTITTTVKHHSEQIRKPTLENPFVAIIEFLAPANNRHGGTFRLESPFSAGRGSSAFRLLWLHFFTFGWGLAFSWPPAFRSFLLLIHLSRPLQLWLLMLLLLLLLPLPVS